MTKEKKGAWSRRLRPASQTTKGFPSTSTAGSFRHSTASCSLSPVLGSPPLPEAECGTSLSWTPVVDRPDPAWGGQRAVGGCPPVPLQDGMRARARFGMPLILCSIPGHHSPRRSLRRSLLYAHAPSTRTSARSDAAHAVGLLSAPGQPLLSGSGSCPTPWPHYCHDNMPSN